MYIFQKQRKTKTNKSNTLFSPARNMLCYNRGSCIWQRNVSEKSGCMRDGGVDRSFRRWRC